jgi:hypothetical protein
LVKQVPGWGLEQRESGKTVLYLQINILLISYIIIYYYAVIKLLINDNYPTWNGKGNSQKLMFTLLFAGQTKEH